MLDIAMDLIFGLALICTQGFRTSFRCDNAARCSCLRHLWLVSFNINCEHLANVIVSHTLSVNAAHTRTIYVSIYAHTHTLYRALNAVGVLRRWLKREYESA
jgi:hypothetical protein